MPNLKEMLLGFIAGGLLIGAGIGGGAYLRIDALQDENSRLQTKAKATARHLKTLRESQASLSEELNNLKAKQAQGYDNTIGALMEAKENASIEALYEIGLKALQAKDYPRAYFALAPVAETDPEFKDIEKQLPAAKKAYEQHQRRELEARLADSYQKALDHQLKGQFAEARLNYQRVIDLKPGYKDARARLGNVSRQLTLIQSSREYAQKKHWLEGTYKLGLNEQALGRFAQAKAAYESILSQAPGYKDAAQRLKAVSARLPKTAQAVKGQNCYEKGVQYANCSKAGLAQANCSPADLTRLSEGCRSSPEFQKGMNSVAQKDSMEMIKGLPDLLKDL